MSNFRRIWSCIRFSSPSLLKRNIVFFRSQNMISQSCSVSRTNMLSIKIMPVPSLFESILCYSNVLPGANIADNFWAVNNTLLQTSTIQRTILCWPAVTLPPVIFIICRPQQFHIITCYNHGNYIGLVTLFQIDQASLYADTQLTVYLLAEQN